MLLSRSKEGVNTFHFLLLCAVALSVFSTFVPNVISFVICVITLSYTIFVKRYISSPIYYFLFFVGVTFLYSYGFGVGHFVELRNIAVAYCTILTSLSLCPVLLDLSKKQRNLLLWCITACILQSIGVTTYLCYNNPIVVRSLGFGDVEGDVFVENYYGMGMASYTQLHAYAIIPPAYLVLTNTETNKTLKLLYLIVPILLTFCLYKATVTTSMFVSVTMCFMVIICYISKGNIMRFLLISFMSVFLLIGSGGLMQSLTALSDGENAQIGKKVVDIIDSFKYGKAEGQVAGRTSLYTKSIEEFLQSPLWGGADSKELGQHSLLIDFLAYYGFFALILFSSWWKSFKRVKGLLNSKNRTLLNICLLSIICMAVFKSKAFLAQYFITSIFIVYLIFPLLSEKANSKYEN